jgi:hypothetical protein
MNLVEFMSAVCIIKITFVTDSSVSDLKKFAAISSDDKLQEGNLVVSMENHTFGKLVI